YVCKWLGHHVQGLDLPDEDFYRNMMGFFAIPRADFRIEPHIELPKFPEKFDVVSAHQICFNGHKTSQLWGAPEWDFFIDDLRRHHLKPGGVIALEFNPEPAVGYYSHKLRDLFAAHGAEMVRGRVTIPIESIDAIICGEAAPGLRAWRPVRA